MAWPLADGVTDEALERRLFGRAGITQGQRRRVEPDWAALARELKRPGVTMTILWEEYREAHPEGYGYSRFCDLLRGFERRLTPVMRQHHVAGELKIVDVKAYAFLEHAGKLPDDLVGREPLVDAPKGGAPGGDTATGLLVDFTFEGDKNASPKYATATIDLTQTGHAGQQVVTHKAFTHFIFSADGHKAVFLESATCMPLSIAVQDGKTEKLVNLDFSCTEVRASN